LFVVTVLRAAAVWWCIQSMEKCHSLKTNSYCCLEQHDHHAWQYWYVSYLTAFCSLWKLAYDECFVCFSLFYGATAPSGPGPFHSPGFYITYNDAPQSVGLLWTSDQLVAETSTWQHITLNNRQTSMPPMGIKPAISAGEWPQTHALDRAASGTSILWITLQNL